MEIFNAYSGIVTIYYDDANHSADSIQIDYKFIDDHPIVELPFQKYSSGLFFEREGQSFEKAFPDDKIVLDVSINSKASVTIRLMIALNPDDEYEIDSNKTVSFVASKEHLFKIAHDALRTEEALRYIAELESSLSDIDDD